MVRSDLVQQGKEKYRDRVTLKNKEKLKEEEKEEEKEKEKERASSELWYSPRPQVVPCPLFPLRSSSVPPVPSVFHSPPKRAKPRDARGACSKRSPTDRFRHAACMT